MSAAGKHTCIRITLDRTVWEQSIQADILKVLCNGESIEFSLDQVHIFTTKIGIMPVYLSGKIIHCKAIIGGNFSMPKTPAITSAELGTLWMTYQQKTLSLRMLEYFIEKSDDRKAKAIMSDLHTEINPYVEKITKVFQREGAVIPVGYTTQDVHLNAPKLYDNYFDIMFIRIMNQISMGMHTLHLSMVVREDIIMIYKDLTAIKQKYYLACTHYLIEKGVLARAPYVSMPQEVSFAKDKNYLSGFNLLSEKRSLNKVEVAYLHHAIETNSVGLQLMTGFAQSAKEPEVKKYFVKGKELAKKIVHDMDEILIQSDVQLSASASGSATTSTIAPFSDKLMMYVTNLLCSFSLGGNAVGTAFSLRSDLPLKIGVMTKDIFGLAHEGAKLMVKNGWLEEPPQMEDRNKLIQG